MAIVEVRRMFDQERVVFNESDVQVIQPWSVQTDDKTAEPIDLAGAGDGTTTLPLPYSQHQTKTWLFATNYQITRRTSESGYLYDVLITYSIPKAAQPSTGKWNLDISIDGESRSLKTNNSIGSDGTWSQAIVNSAGQLAPTKFDRTIEDEQITISFDTDTVDQSNIQLCRGTTNSGDVSIDINGYSRTFTAGSLYLKKATQKSSVNLYGTDLTSGTQTKFWSMSYTFLARNLTLFPAGFNVQIPDEGLYTLASSKLTPASFDITGSPVPIPIQLDGSGAAASGSTSTLYPSDAKGNNGLAGYQLIPQADFSGLFGGLGDDDDDDE